MIQPCHEFRQTWDEHWNARWSGWCSICGFTIERVSLDPTPAPGLSAGGRRLGYYRSLLSLGPIICCTHVCKQGKRELSARLS